MRIIIAASILFFSWCLQGQYISNVTTPDPANKVIEDSSLLRIKYSNTITVDDLRDHLTILAADDMEGRETGKAGNDKAAEYLTRVLNRNGAADKIVNRSSFQKVAFTFSSWEDTDIFVNGNRYRHLWDFLSFPNKNENKPGIYADEVYFMGYGIDDPKYSDYGKKDLKGKIILINMGEPMNNDSISYITGTKEMSDWSMDISKKLKVAKDKGVELVLIVVNDIKQKQGKIEDFYWDHLYS